MAEEDTRVVPARLRPQPTTVPVPFRGAPRQQQLYDLQPGDPDQLGAFRCIHRLNSGAEPVNADKPTPLLGTAAEPTVDGATAAFVVIKVRARNPRLTAGSGCARSRRGPRSRACSEGTRRTSDFTWVARDFYQGVALDQLIGQPEWTRERSTSAARMILVGIAQVHNRREIHCDIKPGNVIVHDRRATLIDFESSRDPAERRPRVVEATKAYASPEQLFGGGPERPILGGTDLFSWALTVCQMFAPGRHPYCVDGFNKSALYAIDQSVQLGVAPPRPDLDALPAGGLRDAVARALAWHPAQRSTPVTCSPSWARPAPTPRCSSAQPRSSARRWWLSSTNRGSEARWAGTPVRPVCSATSTSAGSRASRTPAGRCWSPSRRRCSR